MQVFIVKNLKNKMKKFVMHLINVKNAIKIGWIIDKLIIKINLKNF